MKYFKKNLSLVVSILLLLCIAFATGCEEDNPTEPADPTDNLLPGVSYMAMVIMCLVIMPKQNL